MHWNTHATDVFVRDEAVVGVGGARADVPTVMFAGNRSHVTQFRRPKLAELPRRFEDERGILLEPVDGGEKVFVPYGKTGGIISSVNREIVSKARDAARKWAKDGDEFSARLAFNVLDTYLAGILARNVATDLGRGHMQTLFGMQSMETIHDDVIHETCELYSLLLPWLEKNAAPRIDVYKAALRKWADVQIANGVADNNWDMMQLNYILEIGLALGGDDKAHYVDVVMNQSSVRNYSVKKLAETGFDPDTGIWWECPGYSVGVTLKDFAKFATRVKKDLGIDLLEEIPVLKKAFPAAGEYLFPDGLLIGFGDTLSLNGETEPTEEIAFVESGLYALSYIKDKEARKGRGDLVATFDWKRPEGIVTTRLFMNDAEGRTFIKASAPATEGLSRVKSPNYGITRDSRTPCLVVRQRGEAWDRPFVAVIDPCDTVKGVEFLKDSIRVTRPSGKVDTHKLEL